MSAIPHDISIYQKPAHGKAFIAKYPTTGYKHKLSSFGGSDTASCQIVCTQSEAERFFAEMIGNSARVYVDDPTTPIFDGFINRITYEVGNVVLTRSLDNMMNRVSVTYYNANSAAAQKTEITAVTNNVASQAIYMVKEGNIDAGVHYDNADKTHKTVLRNTLRSIYAYPQTSTASRGGGAVLISIELKGWYHAWDWQVYTNTTVTTLTAHALLARLVVRTDAGYSYPNAAFIYETYAAATSPLISANASFNMSIESKQGQTYLQMIQSLVEAGDGTQKWVAGITKPDPNDGIRRVYYRASNTTVKYTSRALSDTGKIFDIYGRTIEPWRVEPDAGMRVTDILVNYSIGGDDPTLVYLDTIEYDAESQTVSWQSGDDATLEGSMQFRKYFKKHGQRLGAPPRQLV